MYIWKPLRGFRVYITCGRVLVRACASTARPTLGGFGESSAFDPPPFVGACVVQQARLFAVPYSFDCRFVLLCLLPSIVVPCRRFALSAGEGVRAMVPASLSRAHLLVRIALPLSASMVARAILAKKVH